VRAVRTTINLTTLGYLADIDDGTAVGEDD
jgi:hypothetical protein